MRYVFAKKIVYLIIQFRNLVKDLKDDLGMFEYYIDNNKTRSIMPLFSSLFFYNILWSNLTQKHLFIYNRLIKNIFCDV